MKNSIRIAACILLGLAISLFPLCRSFADEGDNDLDLIDEVSIPVIVLHIDESEGHTIEDMHADREHKTECYGTMDIIVHHMIDGAYPPPRLNTTSK